MVDRMKVSEPVKMDPTEKQIDIFNHLTHFNF